jgi:hypothetical protein
MSSKSNSKPPTNGETSTLTSKMASAGSGMIGVIIFSLVSVGMFIGAFVSMSNFVGSKDDWNLIKPQITKIWILTLIGTFGLIIAALLYFIQDSARTIYFILVLSCLTLGLSFSSLAIAAISR